MKIKSTKATKNLTMALSTSHINFDNVTELKSGAIGTLSNKPLNAVVKRKYTKRRPISTSEWRCETAGIGLDLDTLELYHILLIFVSYIHRHVHWALHMPIE